MDVDGPVPVHGACDLGELDGNVTVHPHGGQRSGGHDRGFRPRVDGEVAQQRYPCRGVECFKGEPCRHHVVEGDGSTVGGPESQDSLGPDDLAAVENRLEARSVRRKGEALGGAGAELAPTHDQPPDAADLYRVVDNRAGAPGVFDPAVVEGDGPERRPAQVEQTVDAARNVRVEAANR